MKWKECKSLLKEDLSRISKPSVRAAFKHLLFNPSYKITFWFRIGWYLKTKHNIFAKILFSLVFLIHRHNQFKTGIQLDFPAKIKGGLLFGHFSGIILNSSATIGKNFTMYQCCTVGSKRGANGGAPKIGDNVCISPNSCVIGNITIGNNVFVGAGSVVISDIPDNAVVAGSPAKVINFKGPETTKLYITNHQ